MSRHDCHDACERCNQAIAAAEWGTGMTQPDLDAAADAQAERDCGGGL